LLFKEEEVEEKEEEQEPQMLSSSFDSFQDLSITGLSSYLK
jgi:hypothetical protein